MKKYYLKKDVEFDKLKNFGYEITTYEKVHAAKEFRIDYRTKIVVHICEDRNIFFRKEINSYWGSASILYRQDEIDYFKKRKYLKDLIKSKLLIKVNLVEERDE